MFKSTEREEEQRKKRLTFFFTVSEEEMFHNGSERRGKALTQQILLELWNIKCYELLFIVQKCDIYHLSYRLMLIFHSSLQSSLIVCCHLVDTEPLCMLLTEWTNDNKSWRPSFINFSTICINCFSILEDYSIVIFCFICLFFFYSLFEPFNCLIYFTRSSYSVQFCFCELADLLDFDLKCWKYDRLIKKKKQAKNGAVMKTQTSSQLIVCWRLALPLD